MDPDYAAAYRDLYERHWWWRARERFLLRRLESDAEASSVSAGERRILDIGCGDALFFDQLTRFGTVRGVEPDTALLSDGPWRTAIHAGTLESYTTEAGHDWLLMLDVLEHVSEPVTTLREARGVATPSATLYLTVPAFEALWTRHDDLNHHHVRYDRESLRSVLHQGGWRPTEMTYFFHWLAPLKLLVRLKERVLATRPRVETVPVPPFNALAYQVSVLEQKLLAPLHLPFGTSLYARCDLAQA